MARKPVEKTVVSTDTLITQNDLFTNLPADNQNLVPVNVNDVDGSLIKTDQSLIHIQHNISILGYKLWLILTRSYKHYTLNNIEPSIEGFHYVPLKLLEVLLGYKFNRKELESALEQLRLAPITLNFFSKDGEKVTRGSGFVNEWEVRNSSIGFKLPSHVIKRIMSEGSIETILSWYVMDSFKGKYDTIIYLLCTEFMQTNSVPVFTIAEWRNYMGLDDHSYTDFKELNRRTIKTPIDNINASEISEISIEVEYLRTGRSVTGLKLMPKYKNQPALDVEHATGIGFIEAVSNVFADAKITFTAGEMAEYSTKYTADEIKEIIIAANIYIDKLKAAGKPLNLQGLYKKAFSDHWRVSTDLFEEQSKEGFVAQPEADKPAAKPRTTRTRKKPPTMLSGAAKDALDKIGSKYPEFTIEFATAKADEAGDEVSVFIQKALLKFVSNPDAQPY